MNEPTAPADPIAALMQIVGRRSVPSAALSAEVHAASHVAWQNMLRARRRRHVAYGLAAGLAVVALAMSTSLFVPSRADAGALGAHAGRVEIRASAWPFWRPLLAGEQSLQAGSRLRTFAGAYAAIALPGGGELRISERTEVRLLGAARVGLISGRLYADSGRQPGRLKVETPVGGVRDIGTRFELWLRGDELRVRVRDGTVRWTSLRDRSELECLAGSELLVDLQGRIARRGLASYDPEWDWVATMGAAPDIEGLPLGRLLEWAARESGRLLRFDTPAAQQQAERVILHGQAPRLAPVPAMQAILITTDFDYSLDADGAILVHWRGTH